MVMSALVRSMESLGVKKTQKCTEKCKVQCSSMFGESNVFYGENWTITPSLLQLKYEPCFAQNNSLTHYRTHARTRTALGWCEENGTGNTFTWVKDDARLASTLHCLNHVLSRRKWTPPKLIPPIKVLQSNRSKYYWSIWTTIWTSWTRTLVQRLAAIQL